jgi:hypothetical protein
MGVARVRRFSVIAAVAILLEAADTASSLGGPIFHVVNDYEGIEDSPFDTSRAGYFFEDFESGRRFGFPGFDLGTDPNLIIPGISVTGSFGNFLVALHGMGTKQGNSMEGGDGGKSAFMETRRGIAPLSPYHPIERIYSGRRQFEFNKEVLGFLPTEVGFAWTGGNDGTQLNIRVRDRDGTLLGSSLSVIGDGTTQFIGVSMIEGIGKLEIEAVGDVPFTMAMDHFQYGAPLGVQPLVPEPNTIALLAGGAILVLPMARSSKCPPVRRLATATWWVVASRTRVRPSTSGAGFRLSTTNTT